MASYQQTIVIGHVGRSPDVKDVNGTTVCNFSVAVTDVWTKDGQKHEKTNWYKVAAWSKLGDVCGQYVTKGMQIMVTGNVEARAYIGKDGNAKAELVLTAREVKFLGGRGDGNQDEQHSEYDDNQDSGIPF